MLIALPSGCLILSLAFSLSLGFHWAKRNRPSPHPFGTQKQPERKSGPSIWRTKLARAQRAPRHRVGVGNPPRGVTVPGSSLGPLLDTICDLHRWTKGTSESHRGSRFRRVQPGRQRSQFQRSVPLPCDPWPGPEQTGPG